MHVHTHIQVFVSPDEHAHELNDHDATQSNCDSARAASQLATTCTFDGRCLARQAPPGVHQPSNFALIGRLCVFHSWCTKDPTDLRNVRPLVGVTPVRRSLCLFFALLFLICLHVKQHVRTDVVVLVVHDCNSQESGSDTGQEGHPRTCGIRCMKPDAERLKPFSFSWLTNRTSTLIL